MYIFGLLCLILSLVKIFTFYHLEFPRSCCLHCMHSSENNLHFACVYFCHDTLRLNWVHQNQNILTTPHVPYACPKSGVEVIFSLSLLHCFLFICLTMGKIYLILSYTCYICLVRLRARHKELDCIFVVDLVMNSRCNNSSVSYRVLDIYLISSLLYKNNEQISTITYRSLR